MVAVAVILLASPLVLCSESKATEQTMKAEQTIKKAATAATGSPVDQYKEIAIEYFNKAQELAAQYTAQAQELASKYATEASKFLSDTLDKLGVNKKKTEL